MQVTLVEGPSTRLVAVGVMAAKVAAVFDYERLAWTGFWSWSRSYYSNRWTDISWNERNQIILFRLLAI